MIALIDYDAGNTCSVMNALKRLNVDFVLTDDAAVIRGAEKVIFPGVGHAKAAMESLRRKNLVDVIKSLTQPVLGICVGMQLMCAASEEGDTICLGLIPVTVKRFDDTSEFKVPHMGWNQIDINADTPLFDGLKQNDYLYFVHSYYVPQSEYSIATCDYQTEFSAAVRVNNFYGIQFHAEKSGAVGEQIIGNFLNKVK